MTIIEFIQRDKKNIIYELSSSQSILEIAQKAGVSDIIGRCGGNASCGTCHVYLSDNSIKPISNLEAEVLSSSPAEVTSTSRLACQVIVDPGINFLRVIVAHPQ